MTSETCTCFRYSKKLNQQRQEVGGHLQPMPTETNEFNCIKLMIQQKEKINEVNFLSVLTVHLNGMCSKYKNTYKDLEFYFVILMLVVVLV